MKRDDKVLLTRWMYGLFLRAASSWSHPIRVVGMDPYVLPDCTLIAERRQHKDDYLINVQFYLPRQGVIGNQEYTCLVELSSTFELKKFAAPSGRGTFKIRKFDIFARQTTPDEAVETIKAGLMQQKLAETDI